MVRNGAARGKGNGKEKGKAKDKAKDKVKVKGKKIAMVVVMANLVKVTAKMVSRRKRKVEAGEVHRIKLRTLKLSKS